MPNRSSARAATARSCADGRLNRLPCAVRPISTTVSTVKAKVGTCDLRHIGDEARALARRDARERAAVDQHLAGLRRENAEQRLEQRGLAAAVGAEQRQHLALRERDVEVAPDHAVAVADGEVAAGEGHDQVRCMPASSQMKNGVPMTAVRMPSGISIGAAVRASVSMNSR